MKTMNIAMVGTGFMGKAHAIAYSVMPLLFPAPLKTARKVVVDVSEELARNAADRLDFDEHATDWQQVIARDDIDIVGVAGTDTSDQFAAADDAGTDLAHGL